MNSGIGAIPTVLLMLDLAHLALSSIIQLKCAQKIPPFAN